MWRALGSLPLPGSTLVQIWYLWKFLSSNKLERRELHAAKVVCDQLECKWILSTSVEVTSISLLCHIVLVTKCLVHIFDELAWKFRGREFWKIKNTSVTIHQVLHSFSLPLHFCYLSPSLQSHNKNCILKNCFTWGLCHVYSFWLISTLHLYVHKRWVSYQDQITI